MACRFTYQGQVYDQDGLARALRKMPLSEAAQFIPGVKALPDAPFIGGTENWSTLAFKRVLRWAADNDFERVVWAPGEVQAERYDLSKQVKEIEYIKVQGGYRLGITAINGDGVQTPKDVMTLEDVSDFVGKEIAEKIEKGEGKRYRGHEGITLDGLDLKVGGEGMKGFYDRILPATVNKLVKKWGAKVGQTRLDVPGKGSIPAWSLDITPDMRASVLEGQPLFAKQRIRAYHGSPHDFDRFDITKIGTGEGSQAYGHGLYLAEAEGTARYYREALTGGGIPEIKMLTVGPKKVGPHNNFDYNPKGSGAYENILSSLIENLLLNEHQIAQNPEGVQARALKDLDERIAELKAEWPEALPDARRLRGDLAKPGAVHLKVGRPPGAMYEAIINIDDEKIIDWDAREQPKGVMEAFEKIGFKPEPNVTGEVLYRDLGDFLVNSVPGGLDLAPYGGEVNVLASAVLKEHGIQGIQYLDQMSRDKGEGTRNYVIFDDKLIEIARKYYSQRNRPQRQSAPAPYTFDFNGRRYTSKLTPDEKRQLVADMRAFLAKMVGPGRLRMFAVDKLENDASGAFYAEERLILLAIEPMLARGANPAQVHAHEGGHGLRELGLFSKEEWPLLERVAMAEWMDKYDILERYKDAAWTDLSDHQVGKLLVEEAVFEALGDHLAGRHMQRGPIGAIFDRIARWLRNLRIWLADEKGIGRVSDMMRIERLFDQVFEGELGTRKEKSGDVRGFDLHGRPQEARPRFQRIAPGATFEAPKQDFYEDLADQTRGMLSRIDRAAQTAIVPARTLLQDRAITVARYQQAAIDAGRTVPAYQDTYLSIDLFPRRTGSQLQDLKDLEVEPLIKEIQVAGLTLNDVDEFLAARHVPERTRRIADLYANQPNHQFVRALTDHNVVGGAGISMNEARATLRAQRAAGQIPALMSIAAKVDRMVKQTRETLLNGGLISQEQFDDWSQYRFYVPYRGWENDPDATEDPERPRIGKRFNVRGPEAKAALGRTSKSDSPLTYVILQAQQAIVRAEKNKVDNTFLRFVQANPHPGAYEVNKTKSERYIHPRTGMVTERTVRDKDPNATLFLKVGGKEWGITLYDPELRRGMINNQWSMPPRFMIKMARFFTATRTSYSPEFAIANFMKDIQTGLIMATDAQVKGLRTAMLKNTRRAIGGLLLQQFGKTGGVWTGWARDFQAHGGQVFNYETQDVQTIKDDMIGGLQTLSPDWWKSPKSIWEVVINRTLLSPVDKINTAIENGIRLAAYRYLVESANWSKDKAASYAGNLTTNFTRKGELGPWLNVLYPFYNAGTQGTTRHITALRNKTVRKIAGVLIGAAVARSLANAMLSGEDDDGELFYDKIPNYVKERSMVFMIPAFVSEELNKRGAYIRWGLPYGINVWDVMGQEMADIGRGKSPVDAAIKVGSAMMAGFFPVSYNGDFLQFIVPTLVDPAVELAQNRNSFGQTIMPEYHDDSLPQSQRFKESVNPFLRGVSEWLNDVSGGNPAKPGSIDISPEALEHMMEFVTGGTGTFVNRLLKLAQRPFEEKPDDPLEPGDVPFARVLYGENTDWLDSGLYFDIKGKVQEYENQVKYFRAQNDKAKLNALDVEYKAEAATIGAVKGAEKALRNARDQKRAIKASKDMSDLEKAKAINDIRKRENGIMRDVRKAYHDAGGKIWQ